MSDFEQKNPQQPETVNAAVERLVSELPLKDKTAIIAPARRKAPTREDILEALPIPMRPIFEVIRTLTNLISPSLRKWNVTLGSARKRPTEDDVKRTT